jgi:hypothetical protein
VGVYEGALSASRNIVVPCPIEPHSPTHHRRCTSSRAQSRRLELATSCLLRTCPEWSPCCSYFCKKKSDWPLARVCCVFLCLMGRLCMCCYSGVGVMASIFSEMVYQIFAVHRDRAIKEAVRFGQLCPSRLRCSRHCSRRDAQGVASRRPLPGNRCRGIQARGSLILCVLCGLRLTTR